MISSRRRRLLIIHLAERKHNPRNWQLIHLMIPWWKEAGIEVAEIFGTRRAPPADVAFLHVNLSVVPPEYLDLARRYPVTINGAVSDIRKTRLSQLRVTAASDYAGPVIVKSALNYAGKPETIYLQQRSRLKKLWDGLVRRPAPRPVYPIRLREKSDYRIYSSTAEVPAVIWECPDLVVEKFMPERHGDKYCLREWYFCGDQDQEWVELSPDPIFTSAEQAEHLDLGVPPELYELKKRLGFDYGKFDYTMIDGKPAVFDFNTNVGVANPQGARIKRVAQKLARGIEPYFD
jgi:hypothetical protein